MMAGPCKLKIKGASKRFETSQRCVEVMRSVSLDVYAGEFIVLVGPSGCGKSTLLSMIAGFEKPSIGSIEMDGQPVGRPGPDRLIMFQEHALFPWLTVIDNVAFGLRAAGMSHRKSRELAQKYINLVHLEGFERALVHELSGGMKHRAALARSLAPDPQILLIDEPFTALDAATKDHLYQELQNIFLETKKTIIAVTHDPREAACLADRVIILSDAPCQVLREIAVTIPRPRRVDDPQIAELAEQILGAIPRE
jgi:NitT/TauT family transport system ATP-binding protein